jgi:hypothetical protein
VTRKEEVVQTTNTEQEVIPESTTTLSTTEIVQEATAEGRPLSMDEATKEIEAERVSCEALTEAVREILAAPLPVHLPSAEHTTETITEVEHPEEKPSVDSLAQITEQIKSMISSPVTRKEEEVVQTTNAEQEVIPESTITLFTTETVQETTPEDRSSLVDDATKEIEAEHVSSEALTEAVREILATPLIVHLPSVGSIVDTRTAHTEEQVEIPSTEIVSPHIEQVTTIVTSIVTTTEEEDKEPININKDEILESSKSSPIIETLHETTSEDHAPAIEDTIKENEAELLSSEALTEAVREILAAPLTVHLPVIDAKSERTQLYEQESESALATTPSEAGEKIEVISHEQSGMEKTSEEPTSAKIEGDHVQVITTTTRAVEESDAEQPEPSGEARENKEENEAVSTDSLSETVRQILATPASVHLPSFGHHIESTVSFDQEGGKASSGILGNIPEQIKDIYHDSSRKSDETSTETTTTEGTEQEIG